MKIILSRKGFDSSSGGAPSPIFPDGRMVSLPIPDTQSSIEYNDIRWQGYNVGSIVSDLTQERIHPGDKAHLDPDINSESLQRISKWKPIFGQCRAAQGHLRNNNVQVGDIFLFFGLFQKVILVNGRFKYDASSPRRHIIWGWLQIGDILRIDGGTQPKYDWIQYHPHFCRNDYTNNTLYISKEKFSVSDGYLKEVAGAGVFPHYSSRLVLSDLDDTNMRPSHWRLPEWFYPNKDRTPLTYHSNIENRWTEVENGAALDSVSRGQEFVLYADEYPESLKWLRGLLSEK